MGNPSRNTTNGQRAALSQTTPMYSPTFTPLPQTSMTFPVPNPPANTSNAFSSFSQPAGNTFSSSSQSLNY